MKACKQHLGRGPGFIFASFRVFSGPLTALTLIVIAAPGHAQEWTRFRGPNGSGISKATTIPVTFSEKDFNWKIALPGEGHSSPVIWGKKLFVVSGEDAPPKRHLLCINTADGKVLWDKTEPYATYKHHEYNTFASGSPAVDSDRIYVIWGSPEVVTAIAFDHSGNEVWKKDLGKFEGQHGSGQSPMLVEGVMIVTNDQDGQGQSFVAGLDCKTGNVLWRRPRPSGNNLACYSTPCVYQPKDGPAEVIFTATTTGVTSLNPKTGELNWEAPGVFKQRCVSSPILAGGLIIQTSGQGNGDKNATGLVPGSKKNGVAPHVAFEFRSGATYVTTPIAVGDRVYYWSDAGIVMCAEASSGKEVWRDRVPGNYFGSPVCINGKLYAMNSKGDLVVIGTGDTFKLLATIPLGEGSHATPAVSDGVMYLRTRSHLISVGGKK